MSSLSLQSAIGSLRDAAANLDVWSDALPRLVNTFGGIGGCCFACNDLTGGIEWVQVFGPASAYKLDWVERYSISDLFLAALVATPLTTWVTLSERLPKRVLHRNEWYQDFMRPCGIRDAVGVQLHRAGPYRVLFGLQYPNAGTAPTATHASLQGVLPELQKAARLGSVLRRSRLAAVVGNWTLEHLTDALFVTYDAGRVVAMNPAAERMLGRTQALILRHGRLVAADPSEAEQLAARLADAARAEPPDDRPTRMLVGRTDPRSRQVVTVFPLGGQLSADESALVGVRVISLTEPETPDGGDSLRPTGVDSELGRLFGLSPAELRLVQGLMRGRTLQALTAEFGLQMPTLRAQLRSVLRKCGVARQVDLIQVLLRAQM